MEERDLLRRSTLYIYIYIFNQETSKGVACLEEEDLSLRCEWRDPLIFHSESPA